MRVWQFLHIGLAFVPYDFIYVATYIRLVLELSDILIRGDLNAKTQDAMHVYTRDFSQFLFENSSHVIKFVHATCLFAVNILFPPASLLSACRFKCRCRDCRRWKSRRQEKMQGTQLHDAAGRNPGWCIGYLPVNLKKRNTCTKQISFEQNDFELREQISVTEIGV